MGYVDKAGHAPDFEVQYQLYTPEQGGRRTGAPFQNYRCDWLYQEDETAKTDLFMIWPEFIAADGSLIPPGVPVPAIGLATMWILSDELRVEVHRKRIFPGVCGYFMEGNTRVAKAVVTQVLGLHTNKSKC